MPGGRNSRPAGSSPPGRFGIWEAPYYFRLWIYAALVSADQTILRNIVEIRLETDERLFRKRRQLSHHRARLSSWEITVIGITLRLPGRPRVASS